MYLLLNLYVMKFSTDVLLIAPAVMGLIFAISRVWDAISDPIVGYLSDRTVSRFGRRRTWIVGSLIPISAVFVMVFSPPVGMGEVGLVTWMALGVIGFYSAMTVFFVPHLSLGAELSDNYHERSRLFGMRHAFYTIGSILALVSMKLLIDAEQESGTAVRELAVDLAMIASLFMAIMIVFAVSAPRTLNEPVGWSVSTASTDPCRRLGASTTVTGRTSPVIREAASRTSARVGGTGRARAMAQLTAACCRAGRSA